MLGMVSYECFAILSLSLRRIVSQIFYFKNAMTLKTGLGSQLRLLEISPFDKVHTTSYWRSIVTLSQDIFWDTWLQKCCDLEKRVRGSSRSLKISPFDRAHVTSYWLSVVTISGVVSQIFNVEECRDLETRVAGHTRSSENFPTPFLHPRWRASLEIGYRRWGLKTRMMGLPADKKVWRYLQPSG